MTILIFQHVILVLALTCFATRCPSILRISALPRVLLISSMVPLLIGTMAMVLAYLDIEDSNVYIWLPSLIGFSALCCSCHKLNRKSLANIYGNLRKYALVAAVVAILLLKLLSVFWANARTQAVMVHDFNVYMAGALAFAEQPGRSRIPRYSGDDTGVVSVHPHSFVFEAYLAQSVMLTDSSGNTPIISNDHVDQLAKFSIQLGMIYLAMAIVGLACFLGIRGKILLALPAMMAFFPWMEYAIRSFERDTFRLIPICLFLAALLSFQKNFSSMLFTRGIGLGISVLATVAGHTLGLAIAPVIGTGCALFILLVRRPSLSQLFKVCLPTLVFSCLAVARYFLNYTETGDMLGYGLQLRFYKGTWLEGVLGERWSSSELSIWQTIVRLFRNHGIEMQISTVVFGLLALILDGRSKLRSGFLNLYLAVYIVIGLIVLGVFNYVGINLRDAFLTNHRYPLTLFWITPIFLVGGIDTIISGLSRRIWQDVLRSVIVSILIMLAFVSLDSPQWRVSSAETQDENSIALVKSAVGCMRDSNHWLIDDDVWMRYFLKTNQVFIFSPGGSAFLKAQKESDIEQLMRYREFQMVVFVYNRPKVWAGSRLQMWLEKNWKKIKLGDTQGNFWERGEIWLSPEIHDCVIKKG